MRKWFTHLFSTAAFIAASAFVARILLLRFIWTHIPHPLVAYGYELGRVASSIAAGKGFSSPLRYFDSGPTVWFTPIFPYFVAAIFKIFGIYSKVSEVVLQTTNAAFASLTVIPIYYIAKRTFGSGTAIGAAWLSVFLPLVAEWFFPIFWLWDTALTALLLTTIVWMTLLIRGKRSTHLWLGYGALWAFAVLVNASILSLFPFLLCWALWKPKQGLTPGWTKSAALTLTIFTLALVPWTIRNYRVFGKFIVLRSNFGLELWLGNNPQVPDTWSPWLHPNENLEEAEKYRSMGEIAYMAEKEHEAFAFMRTHPSNDLNSVYRRFLNNWIGVTDSPVDMWSKSPLYLKAFMSLNFVFPLLALFGTLFAYHEKNPEALPYVIVMVVFPLVFYLTHTSLRYRFPMDPIMMVLAAYGVAYPISSLKKRLTQTEERHSPPVSIPT